MAMSVMLAAWPHCLLKRFVLLAQHKRLMRTHQCLSLFHCHRKAPVPWDCPNGLDWTGQGCWLSPASPFPQQLVPDGSEEHVTLQLYLSVCVLSWTHTSQWVPCSTRLEVDPGRITLSLTSLAGGSVSSLLAPKSPALMLSWGRVQCPP